MKDQSDQSELELPPRQLPLREQLFGFTNFGLTCYAGAALQAV